MTIEELNIYSVVIPFVGTLNDDDMAIPEFYRDEKNVAHEVLEETPAIKMRKERMRYYLRYLPVRFLQQEGEIQQKLLLYAIFVTRNWRPIDATNILDLIQNSGNQIIWNDDSQFLSVRCDRFINKVTKPETERTIVYVAPISEAFLNKPSYLNSHYKLMTNDFCQNYFDEKSQLERIFEIGDIVRYHREGFWQDNRFLKISALAINYQKWIIKQSVGNSGP